MSQIKDYDTSAATAEQERPPYNSSVTLKEFDDLLRKATRKGAICALSLAWAASSTIVALLLYQQSADCVSGPQRIKESPVHQITGQPTVLDISHGKGVERREEVIQLFEAQISEPRGRIEALARSQ